MDAKEKSRETVREIFLSMMGGAEKMHSFIKHALSQDALEDKEQVPSRLMRKLHDLIYEDDCTDVTTAAHRQRLVDLLATTSALQRIIEGSKQSRIIELTETFSFEVIKGAAFFLGAHTLNRMIDQNDASKA